MESFGNADCLASWVGICTGNNESAGKRNSGRLRKGNLYIRRLLCEFAHAYSLMTSVFKSTFQPLVFRRCYKRANIAIGHKILHSIFFMLAARRRRCAEQEKSKAYSGKGVDPATHHHLGPAGPESSCFSA